MTVIISVGKYIFFMRKHSVALLGLGLLSLVMITAAIVASQTPTTNTFAGEFPGHHITPLKISADTTLALQNIFASNDYAWPPTGQKSVPPLLLTKLPGDFAELTSHNKRRELFLRSLLPIVLIENRRLREQRALAAWLLDGRMPATDSPMHTWLSALALQFRIRGNLAEPAVRDKLLGRLDVIPPELALAQAAIETGWGSSRFALEGNSLFGQWTYTSGKGLEPNQRDKEASHLVASFPDLRASVRAYMRNLNTGNAYHEFRTARAATRAAGQTLHANELAVHLHRYSQRGEDYVTEVQRILRSPSITALSQATLGQIPQTLVANTHQTHTDS